MRIWKIIRKNDIDMYFKSFDKMIESISFVYSADSLSIVMDAVNPSPFILSTGTITVIRDNRNVNTFQFTSIGV